jgi:hypothetical protein
VVPEPGIAAGSSWAGRLDLVAKEREDGDIVQAVFLQGGAAQGAFARETGLLRDPQRCEVVGIDAQPHGLQAAGVARAELPDIQALRADPHLRKVRKLSHRAHPSYLRSSHHPLVREARPGSGPASKSGMGATRF